MDAPACWGKFNEQCRCEFAAACRLCTETEPRMNRPLGGQNFDSVAGWAPDLADYDHTPGTETEPEPEEIPDPSPGTGDLAQFLNFILHLDDYTLGILAEIIAPAPTQTGRRSVAQLARVHGISRQGMHRKMLDVVRKYPELASLLALSLRKIRRARRNFVTPPRRRDRNLQPELPFL